MPFFRHGMPFNWKGTPFFGVARRLTQMARLFSVMACCFRAGLHYAFGKAEAELGVAGRLGVVSQSFGGGFRRVCQQVAA